MEVATSRVPAIPPRRFTENNAPQPSTTRNMASRRVSQSVTPPPRCSADSLTPPRRTRQSVTPPPRRTTQNLTPPPRPPSQNLTPLPTGNIASSLWENSGTRTPPLVPARWDICTEHCGHKYTALCTNCVKFLCNKCLVSEIYFHQQCSVAYFSEDVQNACHSLKENLCEKIFNVSKTLTNFQTSLCKKRDRMLKKRNETISEIKHYYNRLRELLLSKLNRDEDELLNIMKGKVDNQDTVILQKIQQCCETTSLIQEKETLIQNLEQSCKSGRSGNNLEYVRNLVNTSHVLKECERVEKEVADVRDGFLVIRFFVNSETEQTILNSNVACVEVLNSRAENHDGASLESERISEVAQAISSSTDGGFNCNGMNNAIGELRVALPPVEERNSETDKDNRNNTGHVLIDRNQEDILSEQTENETLRPDADQISDLINEFDTGLLNRSGSSDGDIGVNMLSNEMILSNIHLDSSPPRSTDAVEDTETEEYCPNESGPPPTSTDAMADIGTEEHCSNECVRHTPVTESSQSNALNVLENITTDSETPEIDPTEPVALTVNSDTTSHSGTSESDRRQSVAVTATSDGTSVEHNFPHDDDPPPPYPGLTSSPPTPGPDELPPPYPGTGPPPPYSQNQVPEAQQPPGRRRRNGVSERMLSHFSDSDFQSGLRDLAPPTQINTPRLSRPKLSKVFSVNEANDRRISGIFAVASVHGNAFLIVDRWNKKLKYFSDTGLSFGGLIFREEPWDITNMMDDLVAVTVPKLQTFYKIKVADNNVITTSTVSTLRSYSSIAFNKVTQLFICSQVPPFGEPVVDMIGIDGGQIIQTFRTGFNSELRFSYPRYVKVNEDGIIIVCDWNLKCITLFKLDGSVVGRYRGTVEFPLNEPTGISYNHTTKEVYVIDAKHSSTLGAIHIVNLNCRCREIVRWDNEFRVARAITPHGSGYALGNKSGVLSIFAARQRR